MIDLFAEQIPEWCKKQRGIAVASIHHGEPIRIAREVAKQYLMTNSTVSIDEVREGLILRGFDLSGRYSKQWMGSVFKNGEFELAGYKKSEHVGSHSRIIAVWKMKQ